MGISVTKAQFSSIFFFMFWHVQQTAYLLCSWAFPTRSKSSLMKYDNFFGKWRLTSPEIKSCAHCTLVGPDKINTWRKTVYLFTYCVCYWWLLPNVFGHRRRRRRRSIGRRYSFIFEGAWRLLVHRCEKERPTKVKVFIILK